MSLDLNTPKSLAEAKAMLIDIIPDGCYAEMLGARVWVEQVGNDEFAIFSIPKGEPISNLNLSAWNDFDDADVWMNIHSWLSKPSFGLLRTIIGFETYPRKMFIVSNRGTHPMQQHEEWQSWVMEMYKCVRKHDSRIPDIALEAMRDLLLQK